MIYRIWKIQLVVWVKKTFLSGPPVIFFSIVAKTMAHVPNHCDWVRVMVKSWALWDTSSCTGPFLPIPLPLAWASLLGQKRNNATAKLRIPMRDLLLYLPSFTSECCLQDIGPSLPSLPTVCVTVLQGDFSWARLWTMSIYRQLNPIKYYKLQIIM